MKKSAHLCKTMFRSISFEVSRHRGVKQETMARPKPEAVQFCKILKIDKNAFSKSGTIAAVNHRGEARQDPEVATTECHWATASSPSSTPKAKSANPTNAPPNAAWRIVDKFSWVVNKFSLAFWIFVGIFRAFPRFGRLFVALGGVPPENNNGEIKS